MVYLLNSVFFFLISVIFHIVLSRIFLLFGRKSILLVSVFAVGGIMHFIITLISLKQSINFESNLFLLPLPFTSFLLYMLLVFNYLIYFMATYWGEESPSLKLYFFLKNGEKRTFTEITAIFPKKELIDMRLEALVSGQFIKQKKDVYVIQPRGERLAYLFKLYRKFLGWQSSG